MKLVVDGQVDKRPDVLAHLPNLLSYPNDTLEVGWKFGGNAKLLRTENDVIPKRHVTKHFHSMKQSFEPGEDWTFCYVDKVVMEPR